MKKVVWGSSKRLRQILPSMTSNSLCRFTARLTGRFPGSPATMGDGECVRCSCGELCAVWRSVVGVDGDEETFRLRRVQTSGESMGLR